MAHLFSLHRPLCQAAACRRPAMQQQHAAQRAAFARSAYFGQTMRPQIAKGLQLPSSRRGKQQLQVQAAIFGVGAPEAILVGVVALLVFGPKGLAQAAKSLGQTLRAFQPTIRELTQVSAELKSTLENEIGINEIKEELRRPLDPPAPTPLAAAGGEKQGRDLSELANEMTAKVKDIREDMAKAVDPDIEAKRAESAKLAWGAGAGAAGAAAPAAAGASAAPAAEPVVRPAAAPAASLDNLSLEQLEAELQRRKAAAAAAAKGGAVPKELRADE